LASIAGSETERHGGNENNHQAQHSELFEVILHGEYSD
jgi:hypothetical protein